MFRPITFNDSQARHGLCFPPISSLILQQCTWRSCFPAGLCVEHKARSLAAAFPPPTQSAPAVWILRAYPHFLMEEASSTEAAGSWGVTRAIVHLKKKKKKKSKKRETKPLCTLDGTVKKCMLWTAFFSCSCRQPQPGWPQSCHCQAGWGRSGRGGPPRNECSQSLWMLSASHVISFLHFQFFWAGNLCSLVVKSKGTCVCQALVSPCLLGGAFSARRPERVVHSQQAMQP